MTPLDLVKLTALMQITRGRPEIVMAMLDGPVALDHPDLMAQHIRELPSRRRGTLSYVNSAATMHGTFVAGMLCAKRDSAAPAICPGCTLLVHPIFIESSLPSGQMPSATPEELAAAIFKAADAGARVLNLSVALGQPSLRGLHDLEEALDYAASRGVISVAAAGNQGMLGSSAITRHPGVIPVAACDLQGKPMNDSNLGRSIGRRGLRAPGDHITSLGANGKPLTLGGTSVATPFVTGTIALLWSEFPTATVTEIRAALAHAHGPRRNTVVPPLLDAWAVYQAVIAGHIRSGMR
jgi:subtilisin family serine protease